MKGHNDILISPDEYSANREMGKISEGYMEGIGYAFHTFGYIPPANMNGCSNYGRDTETNFYQIYHGQGLDYSPDARNISRTIARKSSAEVLQQEYKPEKPDPYQDDHGLDVWTLDEFLNENRGKSFFEIINQRGKRDGMPGGPYKRMVRNPNDNKIMDMRHVMVVGFGATALSTVATRNPLSGYIYGNILGLGIEVFQWFGPWIGKDSRDSAFDRQDFYSNNIGAKFFTYYVVDSILTDRDWAESFVNWLKK